MKELFVYKKSGLDVEASVTGRTIKEDLGIEIKELLVINRYIINNISDDEFEKAMYKVFAEKNADMVSLDFESILKEDDIYVITELLPGQFSMRNAAAEECLQFIFEDFGYEVKSQKIFLIRGGKKFLNEENVRRIKSYLINPLEMREGVFSVNFEKNEKIIEMPEIYRGFKDFTDDELANFHKKMSLAMSLDDLKTVREHFSKKGVDPSETEIRVLDTYWSDHCRHTTFNTVLTEVAFEKEDSVERRIYDGYLGLKKRLERENKPVTLMEMATIGARYLKAENLVTDLDVSEEINACSIKRTLTTDKGSEDYLIMFKNETHNHPTEIEPFGGAATCLGGAIRDPLSGRSFVYQAMRVTGAADPTESVENTLAGKLPQKKITTIAAKGYSSYGNQIGLSAGHVHEIYHPGYKAKRMEVGAVIASTPEKYVIREVPEPGDLVILVGGRTGRDGIGGATGSSKSHDTKSIETSGAEVQKGNAPTERKIQRLMRKNEVKVLIRRCNDFGAGGVSVAVGELADGLKIYLDRVPLKYEGLNATETAISESQERMAIVIKKDKLDEFMGYLSEENLSGTVIAEVTEKKNLLMEWYGNTVCDLERSFLDTAGARSYQKVMVKHDEDIKKEKNETLDKESIRNLLLDLNNQSQRALNENFDSTNGCATSVLPFGGTYQDTESSFMAASVPLERGIAEESTVMSYGFDPYLSSENQVKGANTAVVESLAKIAASGADIKNVRLSFQEYFEKLSGNEEKWGKPLKSLLGALKAQIDYSVPAIGGKDSMSGTFNDLNVPPTLISFAVNTIKTDKILTNLLKGEGNLYILKSDFDEYGLIESRSFIRNCSLIVRLNNDGLLSACDPCHRGYLMTLLNMAYGERRGLEIQKSVIESEGLNEKHPECFVLAVDSLKVKEFEKATANLSDINLTFAGTYDDTGIIKAVEFEGRVTDLIDISNEKLGRIFTLNKKSGEKVTDLEFNDRGNTVYDGEPIVGKPKVLLLAMPGTNCEYDMERAFVKAGAEVKTFVLRNRDREDLKWSIDEFAKEIRECNILGFPGGFSAGDEPDGSGKFIANVLWNEKIKDAVHDLVKARKGLVIGICNGFQALIRTGLVTYGEIREPEKTMPLLTANEVGKHMDYIAKVRVATVKSPWLRYVNTGETYSVPVSHGEGRFMAEDEVLKDIIKKGMVMTQYCDPSGNATMEAPYNPNGSVMAIEGIVSPCGRILGKMGHNERWEKGLMKNFSSDFDMQIFKAGVDYFKK